MKLLSREKLEAWLKKERDRHINDNYDDEAAALDEVILALDQFAVEDEPSDLDELADWIRSRMRDNVDHKLVNYFDKTEAYGFVLRRIDKMKEAPQ